MKVAIVVMPFLAADRPSLAAGLLKAALVKHGIACDCKYFNVTLSRMIGPGRYTDLVEAPASVLGGEWIFSQLYYGQSFSDWPRYEQDVLNRPVWGCDPDKQNNIREARALAPSFLRVIFESNDWGKYDLVGFTSTFEQTMPSLCLARMIRERYPQVRLAAGGANFESSMGRAYMEHFPFLDYVCTGEGDICFPQLCENLSRGIEDVPPGLLYRDKDRILSAPGDSGHASFVELDSLPTPVFDDYFRVFSAAFPDSQTAPFLPVETSRGCWWGERSHCTFCGLNGDGMKYRRKDWHRVVEEVDELTASYPASLVQFTDNILSLDYFKNLLPYWADNGNASRKFFEVKSNLTRNQIDMLKRAGVVAIQAGVENLADDTLRLMRKGVTGAQNIAVLRWSKELRLEAYWNMIFGFPNEQPGDYDVNLSAMKLMTHLRPPDVCSPIRLDRFSPNYTQWRAMGFTAIRPLPAYKHVLPFEEDELSRFAYYFDYEHEEFDRVLQRADPLIDFSDSWRERSKEGTNGSLSVLPRMGGGFILVDTRFNFEASKLVLHPVELDLLLQCDSPLSPRRAIASTAARYELTIEETQAIFDGLISRGVIAVIGKQAITLALLPQAARLHKQAEPEHFHIERKEEQWQTLNIL